jgi:tRNA-modifying protein YgfZ
MSEAEQLEVLRHDAAVVDRSNRGFVLVTGDDARSFLQALVSADLEPLLSGMGARSLLLTPQGKLDVAFRLLVVGDDLWLDSDPGLGAQLKASLDRFRIRVKAEVVDRSDEWATISLIGPSVLDRWIGPVPSELHAHLPADDFLVVRTETGLDLVGSLAAIQSVFDTLINDGWTRVGPEAFDAFRIERGVPVQPVDIDDKTIPQEAELEFDAVSFTKGCFLGQELVCRIDSRGHVNRFLRRFHMIEGDWPAAGAEVVVGDKVVGTLTSVAAPDVPTGALGYVRREVEPPATVDLILQDGRTARATVLPLKEVGPPG